MTSPSEPITTALDANGLTPLERRDYGFARVRDVAFDAIHTLWRRRQAEGMKQSDIADAIQRDPAWVSRTLRAPGNWTLRTIGELAEALNGEVEITVHPVEQPEPSSRNATAYSGYEPDDGKRRPMSTFRQESNQVSGIRKPSSDRTMAQVIG